ncbi:hypothetical protein M885DRAFT_507048 [Pelagophyceae sp. CCMP2097]|nr:hypothetical protein M885DRAFT_507048 [Pelagophyceae sp. CCMP2097]
MMKVLFALMLAGAAAFGPMPVVEPEMTEKFVVLEAGFVLTGGAVQSSGTIDLIFSPTNICYTLVLSGAPLETTTIRILEGDAEVKFGVSVVTLFSSLETVIGDGMACVEVEEPVIAAILAEPAEYHVMLKSSTHLQGAIRGQLPM